MDKPSTFAEVVLKQGNTSFWGKRNAQIHKHDLHKAKRFTLDDGFIRHVEQKCLADETYRGANFLSYVMRATLPADSVWIEFDARVKYEEAHRIFRNEKYRGPVDIQRIGILVAKYGFEGAAWRAYHFIGCDERSPNPKFTNGLMMPTVYCVDPHGDVEGKLEKYSQFKKGERRECERHSLSQALGMAPVIKDLEDYAAVLVDVDFDAFMRSRNNEKDLEDGLRQDEQANAGLLRFLIMALAMINETNRVEKTVLPGRGRTYFQGQGFKARPDTTIISLNPGAVIHKLDFVEPAALRNAEPVLRREHGVRSHPRTVRRGTDPNCTHDGMTWVDSQHLWCPNCDLVRTIVPSHRRGSKEKGVIVKQEYVVKRGTNDN